jgi:predicted RNA-binding Zn-ribbon protein involved in translation (DUF1610 family)
MLPSASALATMPRMGIPVPVGYEAWVSRAAKITVPYRCSACGHQDTALVVGMGSGVGGGRGYGRDEAAGLASAAAGEVIERDARRIAAAIRCPKCGAGGRTAATLPSRWCSRRRCSVAPERFPQREQSVF